MEIKFDTNKLLKGIIEMDGSVHEMLRKRVEEKIINNIVEDIMYKYFDEERWTGREKVRENVLNEIQEKQTEFTKKILKGFYDSYKYKKTDIKILQKLKEFLDKQD